MSIKFNYTSTSFPLIIILILSIVTVNGCSSPKDPNKITGDYTAETFIYDTVVTRHLLKHFKNKSGSGEDVPPLLFAVGHNDDFIVAKQHPTSGYERGFVVDPSITNYYLIDINEKFFKMVSNVMGPFTLQQFDSARAVYKIPVIPFDQVYPEHNDAFIDGKIISR